MAAFAFYVYGDAKGQPRQRHFARKIGQNKWIARSYDPGTAEGWKCLIADAAKKVGLTGAMLEGPIELVMSCRFARPKSHFRTGRNALLLRSSAPVYWHFGDPDRDNVEKAVMDCLTQIGAWRNDNQVCAGEPTKVWALPGEPSVTYFSIRQIEDEI